MPTYEYECPECGAVVALVHKMDERPKFNCADCDVEMRRILSPTAGWVSGSNNPCRGK